MQVVHIYVYFDFVIQVKEGVPLRFNRSLFNSMHVRNDLGRESPIRQFLTRTFIQFNIIVVFI